MQIPITLILSISFGFIKPIYGHNQGNCSHLFSALTLQENRTYEIVQNIESFLHRNWRLPNLQLETEMPKDEITQLKAWFKQYPKPSKRVHFIPLAPEAPEMVTYNWKPQNFERINYGIESHEINNWVNKKKGSWSGLYVAADPLSSTQYGPFLMEVVLYKDRFPIKTKNALSWKKIERFHVGIDSSKREFQHPLAGNTGHYVIQDLRAIKEIRWPDKKMIITTWFSAHFNKESSKELFQMAEQWLLTPNYGLSEKINIFLTKPEQMKHYLNHPKSFQNVSSDYWGEWPVKMTDTASPGALRLNGVLTTLLRSSEDLVQLSTGNPLYSKAFKKVMELKEKDFAILESFAKNITPDSRPALILHMLISLRKGDAKMALDKKEKLIALIEEGEKAGHSYIYYKKKIPAEERKNINSLFSNIR